MHTMNRKNEPLSMEVTSLEKGEVQVGVARRCRPRPLSPESGAPTCEDVWWRRLSGRGRLVVRVGAIGATSCGPLAVRGDLLGLRRAVALELVMHVFDEAGSQPARDALPIGVRADDSRSE